MDRTVYDWLYHYWFRCEVEGIEHVPSTGGALLVSNHSGALPPDAAMITKAIKEEHARPRPLHLTVEHFFKGYPGLQHARVQDRRRARPTRPTSTGCCTTRSSSCSSSPRAARAPRSSTRTATSCAASAAAASWRRRCARGCRSCRSRSSGRRRRCRSSPTSTCCSASPGSCTSRSRRPSRTSGWLGFLGYLPAKFKIRFLEPIPTDQWGDEPWQDRGLVQTVADEIRSRVQEELIDMVAHRRSVWFG